MACGGVQLEYLLLAVRLRLVLTFGISALAFRLYLVLTVILTVTQTPGAVLDMDTNYAAFAVGDDELVESVAGWLEKAAWLSK